MSPISLMAWSHEIFCRSPLTSFIGYFSRRSPCTQLAHRGALGAMRAAVDRAVPGRLLADPDAVLHFGDHGAADRAMRADVLFDFRRRADDLRPACALRTEPSGIRPIAAPAPAARPERRRNVRRSRTPDARPAAIPRKRALPADPSLRFINMCVVPSIAIDAIVVLDVIGFLVARLDALGLRLIRDRLAAGERHNSCCRDRRAAHQKQAAPIHPPRPVDLPLPSDGLLIAISFSRRLSPSLGQREGLDSSSMKTRPVRPTAR